MAHYSHACAGSVLTPHDYITTCRKDLATGRGQALISADSVVSSLTHSLNTERLAAPPEPPEETTHVFAASLGGLKLADPGITTESRGLTATQSRPADLLTIRAVPGRSAALDVCVASTKAAAARGDGAQAAFDRKTVQLQA